MARCFSAGFVTKTADVQQIRERFKGLGIVTDWRLFERISNIRNAIEHYYPQARRQVLDAVVTDAFLLVRSFIASELNGDPRELLGEATWQAMLKVTEVHTEERNECLRALHGIDWGSEALESAIEDLSCRDCGSDLIRTDQSGVPVEQIHLECQLCGGREAADSFVVRAIEGHLAWDTYESAKEGGDPPYVSCPECFKDSYVIDERRCAYCGYEAEHACRLCGSTIPPCELDSTPYCGWCSYIMAKDD